MSTTRTAARSRAVSSSGVPAFELRASSRALGDLSLEVWQLPSLATPSLNTPRRIAGLAGKNLDVIESRLLRELRAARIDVTGLKRGDQRVAPLGEDLALRLGLLFRVLAPMRKRESIGACMAGIEGMGREEAAYWLGMAMHRKNPRRVLSALRMLLVE